jgi:signal transduction histidine kinase
MAFTSAVVAVGAGWFIAGFAHRPARRLLADRQGFLADAAHEMRTPLAVILASSSQALSRPRAEEEYVRSLSEIRSAAERAATGVNELLDLVRFDSGQAIPRLAPLRLDLLAEEIAASSRIEDAEVIAEPSQPVVVNADMALVRQAIDNLVRNATRRATRVELLSHVDGRVGVIDVVDNGPGFDPAVIDTAFDRYQRGDRRGDVGIGLAIVKAIAHAHGGDVTVANRNGGATGAMVSLRLPLHAAS